MTSLSSGKRGRQLAVAACIHVVPCDFSDGVSFLLCQLWAEPLDAEALSHKMGIDSYLCRGWGRLLANSGRD